jgi:hypothetical protein
MKVMGCMPVQHAPIVSPSAAVPEEFTITRSKGGTGEGTVMRAGEPVAVGVLVGSVESKKSALTQQELNGSTP